MAAEKISDILYNIRMHKGSSINLDYSEVDELKAAVDRERRTMTAKAKGLRNETD